MTSAASTNLERRVKNHVTGRDHDYFAVIQPGFEEIAASEFSDILNSTGPDITEGGIMFSGRLDSCYMTCLMSRTATRIMMRIAEFGSWNYHELERKIRNFPWELYIRPGSPVRFRTTARKSMIYHTDKLEEIFIAGISGRTGINTDRDNTGLTHNTQTIFLRNHRDICTVSMDASGEFLYKRGDRRYINAAPLRETTASLILRAAGAGRYDLLLDPMCGSGTFSLEAASIFTRTPPGADRRFPFEDWPAFRERAYLHLRKTATANIIDPASAGKTIITSDADMKAVETAAANIPAIFRGIIKPVMMDFFSIRPESPEELKTLLVLNPPYGRRLNETDYRSLYTEIGRKIRSDFRECGYAVIAPYPECEKLLGLDFDRRIIFMNGGIKVSVIFRDI